MGGSGAAGRFPVDELRRFAVDALTRCGVPEPDGNTAADNLLQASLRGVDTHGVPSLLPVYVKRLRMGLVNPRARPEVVREGPSTVLIDGDNGLGAVVGRWAMETCIRKAGETGAAWAAVRHSNHFGICSYFTMLATERGMVGLAFTNGPPNMAPWGSATPYMSTNPLSVALPTQDQPVVLDMATSAVSRFAIIQAAERDEQIPPGWALDRRGRPTTDPQAAREGFAMPLGGHKGSGLAMVIDALCGILSGGAFGPRVGSLRRSFDTPQRASHLFGAIDMAQFVPPEEFRARITQMCDEIRGSERAEGVDRIYVPGEIEALTAARRTREGVPITPSQEAALLELATTLGVEPPRSTDEETGPVDSPTGGS